MFVHLAFSLGVCSFVCFSSPAPVFQVGHMSGLFDSAGYSAAGVWRRRLWVIALLTLLPSANEGIVKNLDQVPL